MTRRHGQAAMHPPRMQGFSLIELMITVGIIAILAAIAYPSYDRHVVKTRRAAAATCLMERAQFMERYYTTNLTYQDAPDPAQCQDLAGHYQISAGVGSASGTTYTLQAQPLGQQASKDTRCGRLTIDQRGVRTVSGTGTVEECW